MMGVLPLESLAAARETGNPVEFSHSLLTVLYPVASEWRPRLTPFIGSETWSHLPSSHHRPFPALIHSWGPSPDLEMLLLQHLSVTLALHLLCLGVTSPSLGPLALRVWLQHRPGWCVCVLFVSPQPTPHAASGNWSQAHLSAWHPPSQKPQKAFGGTLALPSSQGLPGQRCRQSAPICPWQLTQDLSVGLDLLGEPLLRHRHPAPSIKPGA